jgi:branched-chain amino acid transport system substrate-binding protein
VVEGGSRVRSVRIRSFVAVAAATVAVFAFVPGRAGAAAPGVTANSVKIGFVFSKTGVASATSGDSDVGCIARVAAENAKGGVNGRKLDVTYADDGAGNNLTVTQDLVQNKHVYLIINDSAFFFQTYRWVLDNNVPTIGGGFDGQEYGVPGNEKLVSGFGAYVPFTGVQTDLMPKVMKAMGASKVAALGYGISPSSSASVKAFQEKAVPATGLTAAYTNTSVDFGSTEVSPLVLGIKNSGADAAYYAMNANTNLAIAQGLLQNGVKMKVQIMATGYGQQLLDQPIARTMGPEILMSQGWAPVEIKSKATETFQADLKKYAHFTGVPDFGVYTGWIDCDMAIAGLKQQGNNLDPSTFAAAVHSLGQYNLGGGLGCASVNLSMQYYGKINLNSPTPPCGWYLRVKNDKFEVVKPPGGKTTYWTGKIITSTVPPELIAGGTPTTTK